MRRLNEAREQQAERELGTTRVAHATALALAGAFLLGIFSVPAVQHAASPPGWGRLFEAFPTECSLERFERALEDESVVGQWLLPPVQALLLASVGLGNEQVYPGREGWLFHRPGVDYAAGPGFLEPAVLSRRVRDADPCAPTPHPDPRTVVLDFAAQLEARGVRLWVVPTPVKPVVAPAHLAWRDVAGPAHNPSFAAFVASLSEAGVGVFDPTPLLLGEDDYLETDTHWRPEAMERVARALAERIEAGAELGPREPGASRGAGAARNLGDLAVMLNLPADSARFVPEAVHVRPVSGLAGEAPVLLLGDSFSNVYASREAFAQERGGEALDWGADAGLAEQLAFALGRPVARMARNAGGAWTTRVELAGAIARGDDPLRGVRVVVWQFAVRELSVGDWRPVALPASAVAGTGAPPLAAATIAGTVSARAEPPRPGSVPYPDALVAVHLVEVDGLEVDEAVVYVHGMRAHAWTEAARWREGERVRLRVTSWEDETVQKQMATLSRAELDDLELLVLPAFFGELEGEAR